VILRHRQLILGQCRYVTVNSFFYVFDGVLASAALTDATGQAGALSDSVAVFTAGDNDLSHDRNPRD
jgi:hypothetical protein